MTLAKRAVPAADSLRGRQAEFFQCSKHTPRSGFCGIITPIAEARRKNNGITNRKDADDYISVLSLSKKTDVSIIHRGICRRVLRIAPPLPFSGKELAAVLHINDRVVLA